MTVTQVANMSLFIAGCPMVLVEWIEVGTSRETASGQISRDAISRPYCQGTQANTHNPIADILDVEPSQCRSIQALQITSDRHGPTGLRLLKSNCSAHARFAFKNCHCLSLYQLTRHPRHRTWTTAYLFDDRNGYRGPEKEPNEAERAYSTDEQREKIRRGYARKRAWMDERGLCVWNGEWGPVYARREYEGAETDKINERRYAVLKEQLGLYQKVSLLQALQASWCLLRTGPLKLVNLAIQGYRLSRHGARLTGHPLYQAFQGLSPQEAPTGG